MLRFEIPVVASGSVSDSIVNKYAMLSGAVLISRVAPMKRILCICPVRTLRTRRLEAGLAISDPYLSYAIPTHYGDSDWPESSKFQSLTNQYLGPKHCLTKDGDAIICLLPDTASAFMSNIGFGDIGGVLLALPMKNLIINDDDLNVARESILIRIQNYRDADQFSLVSKTDDRLSLKEAQKMAEDQPQMWEEIPLHGKINPSTHASVALNNFLFQHTGGWTNTFG